MGSRPKTIRLDVDNVRWNENRLADKTWDLDVRNIVWDMRYHLDTDRKPWVGGDSPSMRPYEQTASWSSSIAIHRNGRAISATGVLGQIVEDICTVSAVC